VPDMGSSDKRMPRILLCFFATHVININTLNIGELQGRILLHPIYEMKMKKRIIFNKQEIADSIIRIAGEIIERHEVMDDVVLIGIRTCGAFLAKRLQDAIAQMNVPKPPTGALDITLYRDDWTRISATPKVGKTEVPFSVDNRTVILVDDVLFTGRTIRAAMDALIDFGRPRKIELAILVDRGDKDRELPIMANYVGGVWNISPSETINVYLGEQGYNDHISIEEKTTA
jgi:pyrimidine operon attenuation protein / uracil phosphoribosyltransferase